MDSNEEKGPLDQGTEMVSSHAAEYGLCPKCHKAHEISSSAEHQCAPEKMTEEEEIKKVHAKANFWGYTGEGIPTVCIPLTRTSRVFYSYLAVPCCAFFSVLAMALYGTDMLNRRKGDPLNSHVPGIMCFVWFVLFTVLCCVQCAIWCVTFIPARYSRENYNYLVKTFVGGILKREQFYNSLHQCQYAMSTTVLLECLFLVVAQYALIGNPFEEENKGPLDPNFGLLMGVPCLIHIVILTVRLLAWSQDAFEDIFNIQWWDFPRVAPKKRAYYECELITRFGFVARLFAAVDILMGVFSAATTYGISDYNINTDKIQNFYDTWHPCELIDHYPASLIGLFLISLREVVGLVFNLMLMVFIYCRAGTIEIIWGIGVITVGQLLCVAIVNAFSAQLYDYDDIERVKADPLAKTYNLTSSDIDEVYAHTASYLLWLIGMIILFVFQFRMMHRFKIPFGDGSYRTRMFWHVFFVVGNIFTISMTAAMFIAISLRDQDQKWIEKGSNDIQNVIGFMFDRLKGKFLMLMVSPVQKQMFPSDLAIKLRVTANAARGKFGILGRSENVLAIGFWALGFLLLGTYMLRKDDALRPSPFLKKNGEYEDTYFPLGLGFREKPAVYLFAPVWFLVSILFAVAVSLKIHEVAGSGGSPLRVLAIKVIGLALVTSSLMCLFAVIPLWENSTQITFGLAACFPLWFFASQGFSRSSVLYVCSFIFLVALATARPAKDPTARGLNGEKAYAEELTYTRMNVISSLILMVQLMLYPWCFKQPDVRLYYHFEVLNQRTVVDAPEPKQYDMTLAESMGAYVDSYADYAEAAALENDKSNRAVGERHRAHVSSEGTRMHVSSGGTRV